MTFVRVDTKFPGHPKVLDIGPMAEALWLRGLCYAGEHLTDGFVPVSYLRRMGDMKALVVVRKLIDADLWFEMDGGYGIHDYLVWQRSREEVAEISSKRADAGKKGGRQKASNLLATSQANGQQRASKAQPYTDTDTEADTEPESNGVPPNPPNEPGDARSAMPTDERWEAKRQLFEAYCRGVGIKPNSAEMERRRHLGCADVDPVVGLISPDKLEALARWVSEDWRSAGIPKTPAIGKVLEAESEYDRAMASESLPTITPIRTPRTSNGAAVDYFAAVARGDTR